MSAGRGAFGPGPGVSQAVGLRASLGRLFFIRCLDESVDQRGGEHVADAKALHGGFRPSDQQVGLAGAGVADQAEGSSFLTHSSTIVDITGPGPRLEVYGRDERRAPARVAPDLPDGS